MLENNTAVIVAIIGFLASSATGTALTLLATRGKRLQETQNISMDSSGKANAILINTIENQEARIVKLEERDKEREMEIDELKAIIAELETANGRLIARVDALEKENLALKNENNKLKTQPKRRGNL